MKILGIKRGSDTLYVLQNDLIETDICDAGLCVRRGDCSVRKGTKDRERTLGLIHPLLGCIDFDDGVKDNNKLF